MELLENGCLKILLTEEDLNRLGLSFASLDYDTRHPQRHADAAAGRAQRNGI